MSDRSDRKDFREDLGTLLSPLLIGDGNPAQAFYDHLESDFDGRSPVVCLASGGTNAIPQTLQGHRYQHYVNVLVFVTRDDPNADDTLDECYEAIADAVEGNRKTVNWKDLNFRGESRVDDTVWGGDPYWVEMIPLQIEGL